MKIKTSVVSESEKSTKYIRCVGVQLSNEKKILRCIGVQEEKASVAADEMAVKKKAADTNFLEKKIGF